MKTRNPQWERYAHDIIDVLSRELVILKKRHPEKTVSEIFTQGHSSFNWQGFILNILEEVYPDNKFVDCHRKTDDKLYGGKEWLNPKYKEKKVEDILDFTFDRFYPEVIWNLYNKGDIHFNNNRLGDLLGDLLNINHQDIESFVMERKGIKIAFNYHDRDYSSIMYQHGSKSADEIIREQIVSEISIFKKVVINYFYGVLTNTYKGRDTFYCDDSNLIPKYCINLLDIIIEKFKDDIIYVDTDQIFFRYSKNLNLEKFKEILDITELPYSFENGKELLGNVFKELYGMLTFDYGYNSLYDGIFMVYRKYILFRKDGSLIRMRGFITYKDKLEMGVLKSKINRRYKNYDSGGLTLTGTGDTAMFQGQTEFDEYRI